MSLANLQMFEWKNDFSEDCPPFGCFVVTSVEQLRAGRVILHGRQSTGYGAQYDHFLNGPVTVKAGKMGPCYRSGQIVAAYDDADGTPAFGEMWGPRSGTWLLKKNTGGFRIRGVTNTDRTIALVEPAPWLSFIGKTDATLTKGTTGTISIYTGALGSETDTTVNMTGVYNRFADVASGKWVRCGWNADSNGWELVAAEC